MYRLPAPALWILVFAAVLGHFPGLAFDLARDDFLGLGRASGLLETLGWSARPWTDLGTWSIWWRVAGTDPTIPHGFTLLLVAANALLIALAGARIGLPRAGAILAGALWLLGPQTGLAVASTTASADLWALGFALGALLLWLGGNPRRDPPLAALLLVASLASGGAALLLAPVFWVARRQFGFPGELQVVNRGRAALLLAVGALTLVSWISLRGSAGPDSLRIGESWTMLHQLGVAAWLWPSGPSGAVAIIVGGGLAIAIGVLLFVTRRKPAPRLRFGLLWTAATLAPSLLLPDLELSTGALAPAAGLAWVAGALLGPRIEAMLDQLRTRIPIGDGLVLLLVLLMVGPGWALARTAALGQTDSAGRLAHPALRNARIASGVRQQVHTVMGSPSPPSQIVFLQATRIDIPDDTRVPEGQEVIIASPVHRAVAGATGPRLMVAGQATVRWTGLLDDVSRDGFVFLDVGSDRVRPLGPVENARIYAALIAVAAGQYDLARHEFWSVVAEQGAEVRFAFDPDHLPISPGELDAEATGFARWLDEEGSPASLRVLRLFASVYESVRGQKLIEEGWGEPLRSGRVDD